MRAKLAILVVIMLVLLTGCKSTLQVYNVKSDQVVSILKDYVGIHGYQISYQNSETGSFRVELGSVFISSTSQTVETRQAVRDNPKKTDTDEPLTSYEQTTLQTVNTPGHYVQLALLIRVVQSDDNVMITIEDNGYSNYIGNIASDFSNYLQSFGYKTSFQ
jgi:uncharacterized protein YcfL